MFLAALTSRSWVSPHNGHVHCRTDKSFVSGLRCLHREQSWLDGNVGDTMTACLPYQAALYSNCRRNSDQLASAMLLASLWFCCMFCTRRSSRQITWFSRISRVDSLCRKSSRALQIFSCSRATFNRAFSRFFPPGFRRERMRCQRFSFSSCFRRCRGFGIVSPVLRMANPFNPRSMPTALELGSKG